MTPVFRRFAQLSSIGISLALAATSLAAEDEAASGLVAAERAYQEVDFVAVQEQATRALQAGGATLEETARLYVLAGTSAAALGDDEGAKRAFIIALGVDPALKLDRNLSPKIRGPYLEAQGFWGAYAERMRLEAKLSSDAQHLTVSLVDPAHLATKIALHVRAIGASTYQLLTADAARSVSFPLSPDARALGFEYFLRAVDQHENTLIEAASAGDPRLEPLPRSRTAKATPPHAHLRQGRSYLLPAVLAGAGLGAVGVGVAFHVQREDAAREWNGPHCEQAGRSRIQQCGDVDSRIRLDERVAIGSYAAGGALLVGSVVALLVGRSRAPGKGAELAHAGLTGCGTLGVTLACTGRF